jgi:hypothetical protein
MEYHLVARNILNSVVSLNYMPLAPLPAGEAHSHPMPTVGPLISHGHTSPPETEQNPAQYVANHYHELKGFKHHQHTVFCVNPTEHGHDHSDTTHTHNVVKFEEVVYNYSVTRITGINNPVVTPNVGESARFKIPKIDGVLSTATGPATIDVSLANWSGFYIPSVGPSELVGEQVVDGTTGSSCDINGNAVPIYVRYELEDVSVNAVGSAGLTSSNLHKGVVGEPHTTKSTPNGDNNQLIQIDSTLGVAGDIIGIGSDGAELFTDTYEKQITVGIYRVFPEEPDFLNIYSSVHSGIAGWVLTRFDPAYEAGALGAVFYKLGTSPEGSWTPRPCGNSLSVSPDMSDVPSDLNFVGTYWLNTYDLMPNEQWWFGTYYFSYSVDTWYLTDTSTGLGYKKVGSVLDPTGDYEGIAPNTGTYVVSRTPTAGSFSAAWSTPATISYSPVKAFNPLPHAHDLTVTPAYTDLEHGHSGVMDYDHLHYVNIPKHVHEWDVTSAEYHTHALHITDHSHEPVVAGIWRSINILSNVTFRRDDDESPWVLDATDTVEIQYPSPVVGDEVANVEWEVDKAEDVVLQVSSDAILITDVTLTSAIVEAGGSDYYETELYTIPNIPYSTDSYVAGDPEVSWDTGAKTVPAAHIGVIGEAAGTSEQQSLISPWDTSHHFLARDENGVVTKMACGKLPAGIAHGHTYTDVIYNISVHPHELLIRGWTDEDLYLSYWHKHHVIYGYPHTHPDITDFLKVAHTHEVVSCDTEKHVHDVNFIFVSNTDWVIGIENVVDDTFDLVYELEAISLYPDVAGTDLVAETGIAVVAEDDRWIEHLVVSGAMTPDLTGDWMFNSVTSRYYGVYGYYLQGSSSSGWKFRDSGTNEIQFQKNWDDGNPAGTYTPVLGTGTLVVSLYDGISITSVGGASVLAIPATASATMYGYADAAGDPLYTGLTAMTDHPGEITKYTVLGGAVSATMTGVVDDKVHIGC